MTDTRLAPRRIPFEIGTRAVFVQAAVPTGWVQVLTDNDCFLRVVNTAGGGTGGPDNTNLDTADISHSHTGTHYHSYSHTHTYGHSHVVSRTLGLYDGGYPGISSAGGYRCKDNGSPDVWGNNHIIVDGGTNDEGQHDHNLATKSASFYGFTTTSGPYSGGGTYDTQAGDGGTSTAGASVSMVHTHAISSSFKPRYKDIVVGELVA